ncbi:MAG TPA: flagellar hook basal-body protein [Luteibacter sp.]|uniref:flagellar hook-basal body protein n=1 Tax=Luteibacter sp. TaxID=1886636 RepID=UPI002CCC7403|nr:flagellar hook basal-body protein [Luteibacter sp.]HVI55105.1 flagellar hook basal-body protein [Luteibacter sp.]
MTDPISYIARFLSADVRALGTLSQNVANMTTPGYRALRRVEGFGATLTASTSVNRDDGALIHTGRPLDLALQGPGFFQVTDGDRTFLTRNGQFVLGADGRVVDARGRALVGESGPLSIAGGAITIGEDGSVRADGEDVDRIGLVDVPADVSLDVLGDGLYSAPDGSTSEASAKVHQGALEGSNVDPGSEMVKLMELTRHAGSVQHAISTYHSAVIAGIDELGKES